jgi:hypothetical protein
MACYVWATTAQRSCQQVTNNEVPCASLPTNFSTKYEEVPSASSHSNNHHLPLGSLCYSDDPIPTKHRSDFDTNVNVPAQCYRTTLSSSPTGSDSINDTVASYHLHTVVPVKGLIHMTGIPTNSTTPIAHLADTGANCCLCHDESMLVGVHSITPVSIGVATTPEQKSDISFCDKMGYLPLTRH